MNLNDLYRIQIAWLFIPLYCIVSLLLINDKQIYSCKSFFTVSCHFWVKLIYGIYCKFISWFFDCCDSIFIWYESHGSIRKLFYKFLVVSMKKIAQNCSKLLKIIPTIHHKQIFFHISPRKIAFLPLDYVHRSLSMHEKKYKTVCYLTLLCFFMWFQLSQALLMHSLQLQNGLLFKQYSHSFQLSSVERGHKDNIAFQGTV